MLQTIQSRKIKGVGVGGLEGVGYILKYGFVKNMHSRNFGGDLEKSKSDWVFLNVGLPIMSLHCGVCIV